MTDDSHPFLTAVVLHERETVLRMLGEDPGLLNDRDADGKSAVHLAIDECDLPMLNLLLDNGAGPNSAHLHGSTPLHYAALMSNLDAARLLFVHGARVDAVELSGESILHIVAEDGNVPLAELLFAHGADANATTLAGVTPLHQAAWMGHMEMVRLLIKHNANVNAVAANGETVLHKAASLSRGRQVAAYLEQNGARPDLLSNLYLERYQTVAEDLISLDDLSQIPRPYRFLSCIATRNLPDLLELALKKIVRCPDAQTLLDATLLSASPNPVRNRSVIEILLKAGANPLVKDFLGKTASEWMARSEF
jgi:ankyrin repeat protein